MFQKDFNIINNYCGKYFTDASMSNFWTCFSHDSNLTTSVVCLCAHTSIHHQNPNSSTFFINQLSLSNIFPHQSTFLNNQLLTSINFPSLFFRLLGWPQ